MNVIENSSKSPISPARIRTIRVYYGAVSLLLLTTLIAQCFLTYSEGRSLANTFSFFTIQSNVLVLISSSLLALFPTSLKGIWWRLLRMAALTGITVTGIVYIFFLAKYVHLTGIAMTYNYIFHYVMPIATVFGFFVIEARQFFKWKDYLFMIWPILWLVYTMIRGAYFNPQFTGFTTFPSNYPYEFLDISRTPISEVLGSIAFIFFLLIVVGTIYIFSDSRKPFGKKIKSVNTPPVTEG